MAQAMIDLHRKRKASEDDYFCERKRSKTVVEAPTKKNGSTVRSQVEVSKLNQTEKKDQPVAGPSQDLIDRIKERTKILCPERKKTIEVLTPPARKRKPTVVVPTNNKKTENPIKTVPSQRSVPKKSSSKGHLMQKLLKSYKR